MIMNAKPRRLVALDAEDLQVISAHCQDAVLKASDLHYFPAENRFVLEMNRFRWEENRKQNVRARSVLHFEQVRKVRTRGIDPRQGDHVLSLLAVLFSPTDAPSGHVDLVFSGSATLRLDVECIEAQLADMNAAWEAGSKPSHPDD